MKTFEIIVKLVTALAAIAGAIYVVATYGDKIVAWAKSMMSSCPCKCDTPDAPVEEAEEAPAEETPAAEEAQEAPVEEAEEAPVEEVPVEEVPVEDAPAAEEAAPVADESDFVS